MGRSPCCSTVGLTRGAWTAAEDKILTDYVKVHGGGRWRDLPKRAGLKRCGKSCRLRWLNYLRPDIKRGNISYDEEELIIRLHKLLGNRWSLIAGRLPGRTDNEVKNFWNTIIRKRMQHDSASNREQHSNQYDQKTGISSQAMPGNEPQLKDLSRVIRPKALRCSKAYFSPQPKKIELIDSNMTKPGQLAVKDSSSAGGVLPTIPEEDYPSNFMLDVDMGEVCVSDVLNSGFTDLLDSNHCNKNNIDLSYFWDGPLLLSEEIWN